MAVRRDDVLAYLHDFLDVGTGTDYGPNGLQVEGRPEVARIALGVTASLELFRAAAAMDADLIVCHHGLFFSAVDRITGLLAPRLGFLLERGLSLAAYHLPLDRHPEVGNNAVLCRHLGITATRPFGVVRGAPIGLIGELDPPAACADVAARLARVCGQPPREARFGREPVRRVAVVTGGGADLLEEAARAGADLFVTGEAPERAHEQCRELGVSALFGGHYATERFGVQALAELLPQRFAVEARFLDVPNPF
ncbi:MAG TPA: Nif3-like dinuclear metal center hexameric protein [Polyangia bacterium]|jgi:dinuclear metal center YbgI/SA1388 family protein